MSRRRTLPLLARDTSELVSSPSSSSSPSSPPPPLTLESILQHFSHPQPQQDSSSSFGLDSIVVVETLDEGGGGVGRTGETVLAVLLPLLIVLSTLLFLILVFLISVLIMKKKRGIR